MQFIFFFIRWQQDIVRGTTGPGYVTTKFCSIEVEENLSKVGKNCENMRKYKVGESCSDLHHSEKNRYRSHRLMACTYKIYLSICIFLFLCFVFLYFCVLCVAAGIGARRIGILHLQSATSYHSYTLQKSFSHIAMQLIWESWRDGSDSGPPMKNEQTFSEQRPRGETGNTEEKFLKGRRKPHLKRNWANWGSFLLNDNSYCHQGVKSNQGLCQREKKQKFKKWTLWKVYEWSHTTHPHIPPSLIKAKFKSCWGERWQQSTNFGTFA